MKIGVVSPRWFPDFGGAEIYVERFGRALAGAGHTLRVATASAGPTAAGPVQADRRAMAAGPAGWETWYDWVEQWIGAGGFSHVIMNTPLTRGSHTGARRLYDRARASGARVGCFHYDLGRVVTTELAYAHARLGDWEASAQEILARIRRTIAEQGVDEADALLESPLLFGPDFVISCSAWSDRFIDPLDRCARFVLHPFVPADWRPAPAPAPTADIGFVNPLPHKGFDQLLAAIREGSPDWRYRVLDGGYGEGLERRRAALDEAASGRIEHVAYVEDVRDFYAGVRLLMFASRYEGYGMAAVEPGFVGTPTVATDYPAIREGVADSARIVPYDGDTGAWLAALGEVLADRRAWSERALDRSAALIERQKDEFEQALAFLFEV